MEKNFKVMVIGECGGNHNGDFDTALKLIDVAKEAGCDYVKFQLHGTFRPEWINPLKEYCKNAGIGFCATAFNIESVKMLGEVDFYKIASPEGTNQELVDYITKKVDEEKYILISDGAGGQPTAENHIPMRCVSDYPAKPEDYNLGNIPMGTWGVSDHTTDYEIFPMMCVAAGARIIEKHFTLDKTQKGDDHPFALNPDELAIFCANVRKAEKIVYGEHKIIPEIRKILWPNEETTI